MKTTGKTHSGGAQRRPQPRSAFALKAALACTLAVTLSGLVAQLRAQTPIYSVMGQSSAEEANCVAVLNSTASVFGGRRYTPNSGNKLGYVIWERASTPGVADFAKTYTTNSGDFEIVAIDAALPTGTVAVVANRGGAGVGRDGIFMHLSSTGSVLFSRTFNSSNNEYLTDVKCMSDGGFVVTGRIENASTQLSASFATKFGPSSANYPVVWKRVLGATTGGTQTFDRAVAADERADGSILIAGFTDQGASTPEGAVYLWLLDAAGNSLQQWRYSLPPAVSRPFVSDMRVLSTGAIQVIGNSLNGLGGFKGFQMQIAADFLSANYFELVLVEEPNRSIELRSLDARGSSPNIWAAGVIDMPSSTTHEYEGLVVQFSPLSTLMRAHLVGFPGDDALNGIRIESTNGLRTGGLTNKTASPILNMTGVNVLNSRTNAVGNNCNTQDVNLYANPFVVTLSTMSLPVGTAITISSVTITLGTPIVAGTNVCAGAKMADYGSPEQEGEQIEEMTYEVTGPVVFPNPTRSTATLRLPEQKGPTPVQFFDIAGKLVREFTAASTETPIDLSGLRPGLYILQVQSVSDIHRLKLMVE